MKLLELKQSVDFAVENLRDYQSPSDISVLITTNDRSVGGKACSGVRSVDMGFDWEDGQFRIEPSSYIITESRSRSHPVPVTNCESGGVTFTACGKCLMKVAKDDGYCRHCGQKLI